MSEQTNVSVKAVADFLGLDSGQYECDTEKGQTRNGYNTDCKVYDFEHSGASTATFSTDVFVSVQTIEHEGHNALSFVYSVAPNSNYYQLREIVLQEDGKTFARDFSTNGYGDIYSGANGPFDDAMITDVSAQKAVALLIVLGGETFGDSLHGKTSDYHVASAKTALGM